MPNEAEDAKTEQDPSSVQDAKTGESSTPPTPEKGAETPQTMAEVARLAYEESTARNEGEPEKKEESPVQQLDTTPKEEAPVAEEEQQPEQEEETVEEEDARLAKEKKAEATADKNPPPFHDHPRWIERGKQLEEAKTKTVELSKAVEQAKPALQFWSMHEKFVKDYGIDPAEVRQMMEYLAYKRVDPQKARELLEPEWNSIGTMNPNVLPRDLQESVTAGEITEEYAKRLWKAEVASKAGQQTGKFTAAAIQRNAEQARQDAIGSWDQAKRGQDPDFRPKKDKNAPDGLFEVTSKEYLFLKVLRNPQNAQDEVSLLEEAYKTAKSNFRAWRPAPKVNGGKLPNSRRSSGNRAAEPTTLDGVVSAVAREHGIDWNGRSTAEE